jgi:hypothetical protein
MLVVVLLAENLGALKASELGDEFKKRLVAATADGFPEGHVSSLHRHPVGSHSARPCAVMAPFNAGWLQ